MAYAASTILSAMGSFLFDKGLKIMSFLRARSTGSRPELAEGFVA